ncbi:hypothetical protein FGG08_004535 [Glutinoglossum americanum]|uniref:Uncharacterized protein n=1 Tax=Glutinoglossum americanum TaxID=1670608 RepID=A0A9P8I240_9PEZI|nr:hypothetical protein FGG08_004535 [Glutinoglossum americanum]
MLPTELAADEEAEIGDGSKEIEDEWKWGEKGNGNDEEEENDGMKGDDDEEGTRELPHGNESY